MNPSEPTDPQRSTPISPGAMPVLIVFDSEDPTVERQRRSLRARARHWEALRNEAAAELREITTELEALLTCCEPGTHTLDELLGR